MVNRINTLSVSMPICPLIQQMKYRYARGFAVKCRRSLSHEAMNKLALTALKKYGSIYVTGENYSRLVKDQVCCINYNDGIGKTSWIKQGLIPELSRRFKSVRYINFEESFSISPIIRGELSRPEIDRKFRVLAAKLNESRTNSSLLILDECQVLFPLSGAVLDQPKLKLFTIDASYYHQVENVWQIIKDLKNAGVKIVFVSLLHPQDASLTGSRQKMKTNIYRGDPNLLMIFDSPVFELEGLPLNDQLLNL
jgi:hypothetical protein